jgi:hypothetical protein
MLEALGAPFLRAARAHGIPLRRQLFGYALRAAANPLCTLLGSSIASLPERLAVDRGGDELGPASARCCWRRSWRATCTW